ncbi:MAG: MoxR family ATPase [Thermoplasmata archaeon]
MKEVAKVIIGKEEILRLVMVNILSDGHILFEDFPGLAKTLMANTFARALGCDFKRIQFTPDLLPADITGTYIFDEKDREFKFRKGPLFTNILLADEINRAPPKTQAALLEAMQEKQVTIEGVTHKLPRPFIVLATQNPIEYEGTYPLPEAQLDRFLMKTSVGYPSRDEEDEILRRRDERSKDDADVTTITNQQILIEMQRKIENVYVDPRVRRYMVELVAKTREDPRVLVGSSPRGSLALFKLSRAYAAISGYDFVRPDDVKAIAVPAIKHRLVMKPEARIKGATPESIVQKVLESVPAPTI